MTQHTKDTGNPEATQILEIAMSILETDSKYNYFKYLVSSLQIREKHRESQSVGADVDGKEESNKEEIRWSFMSDWYDEEPDYDDNDKDDDEE